MPLASSILWSRAPLWACLALLGQALAIRADPPAPDKVLTDFAEQTFQQAQAHYRLAPNEVAAAWQFARACFGLAEFATNKTRRAALAEQGIAASQLAITRASNSAPAHYYLGMNLGQLARTRGLSALKLVSQMQLEFTQAHDLDPLFDWAGPDRNLGLLYREAPVLGSIGSRSKAREHLTRATELAPKYPDNRLNLVESYVSWGEPNNAQRELLALEAMWPSARTNFVGAAWAALWVDWAPRLQKLQKKIKDTAKPLGAPRHQS